MLAVAHDVEVETLDPPVRREDLTEVADLLVDRRVDGAGVHLADVAGRHVLAVRHPVRLEHGLEAVVAVRELRLDAERALADRHLLEIRQILEPVLLREVLTHAQAVRVVHGRRFQPGEPVLGVLRLHGLVLLARISDGVGLAHVGDPRRARVLHDELHLPRQLRLARGRRTGDGGEVFHLRAARLQHDDGDLAEDLLLGEVLGTDRDVEPVEFLHRGQGARELGTRRQPARGAEATGTQRHGRRHGDDGARRSPHSLACHPITFPSA